MVGACLVAAGAVLGALRPHPRAPLTLLLLMIGEYFDFICDYISSSEALRLLHNVHVYKASAYLNDKHS